MGATFQLIFTLLTFTPTPIPEKKLRLEGVILNYFYPVQILGFDILLMKNLKPILLEVNANPSMRIEHEKEVSLLNISLNILPYSWMFLLSYDSLG